MLRPLACLLATVLAVAVVPHTAAQAPSPVSPAPVPAATPNIVAVVDQMRVFTQALGVECLFCHVDGPNGRLNYRSDDNPRKQVARSMIAMTADINKMVGLGRGDEPVTPVTCRTCHRGVPNPRPIADIVRRTVQQEGGQAAAAEYRGLRQKFFGAEAYDFREDTLLGTIQTFIDGRPDDAIELLKMNLEFHPQSSRGYSTLAYAFTRRRDDASAISALERALELDPDNSIARGQLEQLRRYQRRR